MKVNIELQVTDNKVTH